MSRLGQWLKSPHARLRDDYRMTFGSPHGRRVLADLLKFGHVSQSVVVLGDNGQGTGVNEGKRLAALRCTSFINMEDDEIVRLAQRSAEDGEEA